MPAMRCAWILLGGAPLYTTRTPRGVQYTSSIVPYDVRTSLSFSLPSEQPGRNTSRLHCYTIWGGPPTDAGPPATTHCSITEYRLHEAKLANSRRGSLTASVSECRHRLNALSCSKNKAQNSVNATTKTAAHCALSQFHVLETVQRHLL